MPFDMDTLFSNRKALITIYFPSTGTYDATGTLVYPQPIYALAEHDFNFSIHSLWSGVDLGTTGSVQQSTNAFMSLTGGVNRVTSNLLQTIQRWNGHQPPVFTIPITVIKYKSTVDILGQVSTVISAPAGYYDNIVLKAPFQYGSNGVLSNAKNIAQDIAAATANAFRVRQLTNAYGITNDNLSNVAADISSFLQGTYTLRIGDYFLANNLIIQDASATISKETVQGSNEPLYAQMQVQFTTAYLPDSREIQSWFLPKAVDLPSVAGADGNRNAPLL